VASSLVLGQDRVQLLARLVEDLLGALRLVGRADLSDLDDRRRELLDRVEQLRALAVGALRGLLGGRSAARFAAASRPASVSVKRRLPSCSSPTISPSSSSSWSVG